MKNRNFKPAFNQSIKTNSVLKKLFIGFLILALSLIFLTFTQDANTAFAASETTIKNTSCANGSDPSTCEALDLLDQVLNFMAIIIIPVITIVLVVGGVQYTMAGGNPENVRAAQQRLFKAALALVLFAVMWSVLKWLIPGGLE